MAWAEALKRVAAVEALDWARRIRGVLVEDKDLARAEVLADQEYDVARYVTEILVRDKARAMLRAVGQAIRTGKIPTKWDNADGVGELISTGLKQYDPRVAFQASLRSAYAAGREERIDRDEGTTHKVYRTMRDSRVRDSHRVLDGLVLPKSDPAWNVLSAPNGWRCRCKCYGVNEAGIARLESRGVKLQREVPEMRQVTHVNKVTGERETLPEAVEPGWGVKPGTDAATRQLAKLLVNRQRILAEKPLDEM